jgi:hypothetical protein
MIAQRSLKKMSTQSLSSASFETLAIYSNISPPRTLTQLELPLRLATRRQISRLNKTGACQIRPSQSAFIPALHLETEPELTPTF